jgi:type I restriction enzyme S subunit
MVFRKEKLGTLLGKVGSGVTPKGGSDSYVSEGVPLIRSQNVLWGKLSTEGIAYIEAQQHAKMSGSVVRPNDVLLNITGASIGRACVVPSTLGEANVNQHVCILRVGENLDSTFLCNFLISQQGQREIALFQAGGNREGLNYEQVRSFEIPLPPLAEQRKVAEILRTWDEAIETAEAELKAKQSLLKRAVDKYFERTYRDAASGTVGELKTLDAVCTRKGEYGAAVSACPFNPEWPRYIRITDITDTGILKKERAVSISPESAEGYRLEIGDLMFARTGEPGRCLIFNEAYPAAFAGYLIRFKARPEVILSDYIYYYTLSSVYGKWVGDVSQKGAQANINAKVYGSLQLPVTDLASQGAAVRAFKALQEDVLLAERGVELLSAQKRGLMQKLLTGEVRVNP